jgi:hypothetical protein
MAKSKKLKRVEAQERQASYDSLSTNEKLIKLAAAPGQSKREFKRLFKKLQAEKQADES